MVLGAIVIIAGVALWWSSSTPTQVPVDQGAASAAMPDANNQSAANTNSGDTSASVSATVAAGPATSATVTYDGSTFSPSSVTIAKGGTVKFVDSSGSMWIASNQHPTHTGYDGTSRATHCAAGYSGPAPFDECSAGTSFSYTFSKAGTWGYHDHLNAGAGGTVVVQ